MIGPVGEDPITTEFQTKRVGAHHGPATVPGGFGKHPSELAFRASQSPMADCSPWAIKTRLIRFIVSMRNLAKSFGNTPIPVLWTRFITKGGRAPRPRLMGGKFTHSASAGICSVSMQPMAKFFGDTI